MEYHSLPTTSVEGTSILAIIAKAASDPSVNIEKMQALLDMQERLMARQAEAEFNEAMARLQPRLPRITKKGEVRYPINKNDPEGPSRHAFSYGRIEDIDEAIRPLLNEEGFSLSGNTIPQADGRIIVTTTLLHRGGHSKTAQIGPLPLDTSGGKNNVQALGSVFSYGYRYGQRALLNLVYEGTDDDGEIGGNEPITADECAELMRGLKDTNSNLNQFLAFMAVAAVAEIHKRDLVKARNAIEAKRRKR